MVFLLAVASAKRISELQAFSAIHPYIIFLQDRVLLKFSPYFRPKVPTFQNINQVISLQVLFSASSSDTPARHPLDILRCLQVYVDRSREFRIDENLLILFAGKSKGRKASKATISRWIKEAIREAFVSQSLDPPEFVKAHSTRAVSTSVCGEKTSPLRVDL